jgi:hypothetical protein
VEFYCLSYVLSINSKNNKNILLLIIILIKQMTKGCETGSDPVDNCKIGMPKSGKPWKIKS